PEIHDRSRDRPELPDGCMPPLGARSWPRGDRAACALRTAVPAHVHLNPEHSMEPEMKTVLPTLTATMSRRSRSRLAIAGFLAGRPFGLIAAFPSQALDLVAFGGIGGPLAAALGQLAALAPGVKALVGFVGFVVAFISLAALRNFGPVLFYLGMAIFGAVG